MPCWIAALSLLTIAAGVPGGATTPFQPITSKPFKPADAMVGRPGTSEVGESVATPSPRTVPPAICACAVVAIENIICTLPAITALSAELASRYGTWTMLTPVMALNSSPPRCGGVPIPDDAYLSWPGLDFASAISSCTDLAGTEGCT